MHHDRNGDGVVSPQELPRAALFRVLDVDGDGAITRNEVGLSEPDAPALVLAPSVIPANQAVLIGRSIPDLSLSDLDGVTTSLHQLNAGQPVVMIIRDPHCPMAAKFAPAQARTALALAQQGIATVFVHIGDTLQQATADRARHGFTGIYVHDIDGAIAGQLQAATTTEVFLLDAQRRLRYRGALSDQYGLRHALDEPRFRFLEQAVGALLAGREPAITATRAPGCALDLRPTVDHGTLTWHQDIKPIIDRHCVTCHRSDGPAPFHLETYAQVSGRRKGMIKVAVDTGLMPPWYANPQHGSWANDRRLSAADRQAIVEWIDAGCPEGEDTGDSDSEAVDTKRQEWQIGTPDLVLSLPEAVQVPAEGTVPYMHVSITNPLAEDRWVEAYEIIPGEPAVVHHVLVFLDDEAPRQRGGLWGFFAGMVPGQNAVDYGPGFALKLPAKSKLLFQLHYTTNGKVAFDQTKIGFRFADAPPQHAMVVRAASNARFMIPPSDPDYAVPAEYHFRRQTVLTAFMPHMHVRGKAYRYELVHPDGRSEILLDIPEYDFNWQLRYQLAQPRLVEPGTTLRATGRFDNSPGNPANPDPSASVTYGEQTWDEMQIGYWEGYER